jgi:hypothetical protein
MAYLPLDLLMLIDNLSIGGRNVIHHAVSSQEHTQFEAREPLRDAPRNGSATPCQARTFEATEIEVLMTA